MTLRPEQLRDHAIRMNKYNQSNVAKNLSATGDKSEQRARYQWTNESDEIVTRKIRMNRSEFDSNPFFNQYPPYFQGHTEYAQRYVRERVDAESRDGGLKTSLVINPSIELESATKGRPMATSAQSELAHSVYRETFDWPHTEPRKERFEWLNK